VTRTVWVVMGVLAVGLAIPAALIGKDAKKTKPQQEASRLLRVPTESSRRVIVPPCGTGVPVASIPPDALAKTPGSIAFRFKKGRGDRLVLVPRCRASQGAAPSEGVNLPSAAFVLPVGAQVTAGRGGSAMAGTELVQSQLYIAAHSEIDTIVVPRCIESEKQAEETATGRTLLLKATPSRPRTAIGPPC
jgi:hypothetical protein